MKGVQQESQDETAAGGSLTGVTLALTGVDDDLEFVEGVT
jgi:hypothetical protein